MPSSYMSDALTCPEIYRAKDVDLAVDVRASNLTKRISPSYFELFPQDSSSNARPVWNRSHVHRIGDFPSVRGFVAVV
jgi:hypothetical protein